MSAMTEELALLVAELKHPQAHRQGMREYTRGRLWDMPAVLAFSRWGKVAAATTATHLITHHRVDALIFTGVAGGIAAGLRQGDVVIGTDLYQHDMDARPVFARHEIPLLGQTAIATDLGLRAGLEAAAARFLASYTPPPAKSAEPPPQLRTGAIASGDQFFASQARVDELRARLPDVLCVEMEGAAVAQVCHEYGVPFGLVRTISDSANEAAAETFPEFVNHTARVYSHGIVREWITSAKAAGRRA
jgi:adenosylhomocysteine nucleosidase